MNRIGILTYHFADNYGAVLQTYSLKCVIDGMAKTESHIIPYIPTTYVSPKYWKNEDEYIKKRKSFWDFLKNRCGVNRRILSKVSGDEYDTICVGSDQVWNRKCIDTLEYFLPNVKECEKKIAYAASLGLPMQKIAVDRAVYEEFLPKFRNISIREEEHKAFVEEVSGKTCSVVLDPTLLVDFSEIEQIVALNQIREEEFIFFFALGEKDYRSIEFVNTLSRIYGCKVVHTFTDVPRYMFAKDGGCMYYSGIEEFLWYIKNAKIVVTDSYHGMNLAIRFHKEFYVFSKGDKLVRFRTVVEKLGLQDRIVAGFIHIPDMNHQINYDEVEELLAIEQKKSREYLQKALR